MVLDRIALLCFLFLVALGEGAQAVSYPTTGRTHRRNVQATLSASVTRHQLYRRFFEAMPEAVLLVSEEGVLLDANPEACRLLGYMRDELLDSNFGKVLAGVSDRWVEDVLDRGCAGDRRKLELRLVRRDGTSFVAELSLASRTDEHGACLLGILFRERLSTTDQSDEVIGATQASIEDVTDLGILCAADNTVRYVSPVVERVLGYQPKELEGISVLSLTHPDDWGLVAPESDGTTERKSYPVRYQRKDGSWFHSRSVTINLLEDSSMWAILVSGRDAARRLVPTREVERSEQGHKDWLALEVAASEAEDYRQKLRESTERFRATFEQAAVGIALVSTDGRWLLANRRLCDIAGYPHEELLGLTMADIARPEAEEAGPQHIRRLLTSDAGSGARSMETRWRRKDGSLVWVNLAVSLARGTAGEPEYFVCVVEDITGRKSAESELRRQRDLYETLLEAQSEVGEGLVITEEQRIVYANEAFCNMCGYDLEELETWPTFVELISPELRASAAERLFQSLDGERDKDRLETVLLSREGREVKVELGLKPLRTGERPRLVGIVRDVTERKETEESLRRSLGVLLALREAGQILGSTLESEEIVTRLLKIMRGVSGLTAAVISIENEQGEPRIWRAVGLEELWRRARYAAEAQTAREEVLETGELRSFELWRPGAEARSLVGLCLPLRTRDHIAGVLEAYGPESLAETEAVEILRSLAAQAASALENAELYGELAEREQRLAELVGQLFATQEEERRRVSYEVHDGLAQVAAAAHQHLQAFAQFYPPNSAEAKELLDKALSFVQRTVGEARRVISHLRPTALDDFGLEAAVRLEIDELRTEGFDAELEANVDDDERLPVAVETALFRIAQEALTNARRHAGTKRVRVVLERLREKVRLRVRDWGRGFDPASLVAANGPGERVGLSSMRERVALLGGDFRVHSHRGVGTLIVVEVPLPKHHTQEAVSHDY